MPAYKDSKTGTWFVKFYCKDWTGENKQIKKRGFATKREALDYERNYKIRQENNLDMTFGEFWKLYTASRTLQMSYPDYSPAVFCNYAHNQVLPSLLQILSSLSVYFPQSSPYNRI